MMTDLFTLGMRADTSQLKRGKHDLDNFSKSSKGVDVSAQKMAGSIRNATAAVAAFLATSRSVQALTSFEDAMLGLQAVTRATTADMAELEKQSRSLGAASVFSATEAANAQRFLAQAGFDVNEVMKATPTALKLAQAGSLELAAAADIASNVLGGMRLEVDQFNRVADVMAETAANSNTNIEQLGQALSFAAPVAAGAGVSIELASAAIGKLSDAGLQGTRAGTGLLGVIRQLSAPSKEAAGVLSSYGLTLEDVNIQANGLENVLNKVATAGLSTTDMFKVFGSEAQPAAAILMDNVEALTQLEEKLISAEGAAQDMADIMSSGLSASFKSFNSQVNESILQIGDSGLGGGLKDLTDTATGVLSVYNGMGDQFAAVNKLTIEQQREIENLAETLKTTGTILATGAAAYAAYTLSVKGATVATQLFNRATKANPIGAMITVLGLGAGALLAFRDETASASDAMRILADQTGRFSDNQKDAARTSLLAEQVKIQSEIERLEDRRSSETARKRRATESQLQAEIDKLTEIKNLLREFDNTPSITLSIPTIVPFSGSESELGIKGYTDEIERLTDTYKTADDPLKTLLADQAKLNELLKIAGVDNVPALENSLAEVNKQIADLTKGELDNKVDWEGYGVTIADGLGKALVSGEFNQILSAGLSAGGSALGMAIGGPMGAAFGGAIGGSLTELFDKEIQVTFEEKQLGQGTGTVLGSINEKSASIANGIELIENVQDDLLGVNKSMLNELKNLNGEIRNTATQIAKNVSFSGIADMSASGTLSDVGGTIDNIIDTSTMGLASGGLLGNLGSKLVGGIFGGKKSISDEGVKIIGGTINDIINKTTAKAYQEVRTSGGLFRSSSTDTYTKSVSARVEKQFDVIYKSIVDAVSAGATTLGMGADEINNVLKRFRFSSMEISLRDMSSSKVQSTLESVFSSQLDKLTRSMFSYITDFQDSGESFGDTLSRIATELEVARVAADRLGQSLNLSIVENVTIADLLSEASGGVQNFASNIAGFTDTFYSSSEQAAFLLSDINDAISEMGMTLPATETGFRALVEAQDISTKAGAKNIAVLLDLQDEASEYYDLLDRATGGIIDFVRDLMGLTADGTQTLAGAKAAYESTLAAATAGDEEALRKLTSVADAYLGIAKTSVATAADLAGIRAGVISGLTGITGEIPAYANGTDYHQGGWAMVGERGAELVSLPQGSSVTTASNTAKMLDNSDVVEAINRLASYLAAIAKSNESIDDTLEDFFEEYLTVNEVA